MIVHILSVMAFMLVTFAAQGVSHFVINADHFASIGFLRAEPIMAMGFAVMIIQGAVLSFSLQIWKGDAVQIKEGLLISLIFGAFLVSYIALAEPAKYAVPSITDWLRIELIVGFLQFGIFGLVLGWLHRRFRSEKAPKGTP